MKLSEVVAKYVNHKQSMGMSYATEAKLLALFCQTLGDVTLAQVSPKRVRSYLASDGQSTRYKQLKYTALAGFYRFAITRGHVNQSPLPRTAPKLTQSFVPYIYSRNELRRLLDATAAIDHPLCRVDPDTFRTLLLMLYGAGLRISEALKLTVADVDLEESILRIRESKFYKTRIVPIGMDLTGVLRRYAVKREQDYPVDPGSPFFLSRRAEAIKRPAAEHIFSRLRVRAGVLRNDGARYQPRLHDVRHSFVVHRLTAGYRSGANVQSLLPQLATYLGHAHISSTQRYLTLTPELLREASLRFERYAMEEHHA
jgi:integrase/recombinase XerD